MPGIAEVAKPELGNLWYCDLREVGKKAGLVVSFLLDFLPLLWSRVAAKDPAGDRPLIERHLARSW